MACGRGPQEGCRNASHGGHFRPFSVCPSPGPGPPAACWVVSETGPVSPGSTGARSTPEP